MIGSLKRQWGDGASGKSLVSSEFFSPMIAVFESWPGYGGLTYQRINERSNNGFESTTCPFQFDIIISDK
jgi:hypothetical protein